MIPGATEMILLNLRIRAENERPDPDFSRLGELFPLARLLRLRAKER